MCHEFLQKQHGVSVLFFIPFLVSLNTGFAVFTTMENCTDLYILDNSIFHSRLVRTSSEPIIVHKNFLSYFSFTQITWHLPTLNFIHAFNPHNPKPEPPPIFFKQLAVILTQVKFETSTNFVTSLSNPFPYICAPMLTQNLVEFKGLLLLLTKTTIFAPSFHLLLVVPYKTFHFIQRQLSLSKSLW